MIKFRVAAGLGSVTFFGKSVVKDGVVATRR